jgi:hypothetical protein
MNSILFAVTRPDDGTPQLDNWNGISSAISTSAKTKTDIIQPLGRGACLIRGASGLIDLGEWIKAATDHRLHYKILLLEEVVDWTPKA